MQVLLPVSGPPASLILQLCDLKLVPCGCSALQGQPPSCSTKTTCSTKKKPSSISFTKYLRRCCCHFGCAVKICTSLISSSLKRYVCVTICGVLLQKIVLDVFMICGNGFLFKPFFVFSLKSWGDHFPPPAFTFYTIFYCFCV